MQNKCVICDSRNARSNHFGARTCKACAAFFRRATAIDAYYVCIGENRGNCEIHFEKRIICKHCRYKKCLEKNMQKRMVQSQRDGHVKIYQRIEQRKRNRKESINADSNDSGMEESSSTRSQRIVNYPVYSFSDTQLDELCQVYYRIESDLNVRRMMSYTKRPIKDAFSKDYCVCPYSKDDLIEYDFNTYAGCLGFEFAHMIDQAKTLPGSSELSSREQNLLFRYLCGVDVNMNTGLHTSQLGIHEGTIVTADRYCYKMVPLPPAIDDPELESMLYGDQVALQKYKLIFGHIRRLWINVVVPYCKLNFSYEEHCLVKFLATWQLSFHLFSNDGLKTYDRESKMLIRCLHRLCMRKKEGEVRFGHLLLFLSTLFEEVNELLVNLQMVHIFHDEPVCPNLGELLNFDTA